MDRAAFSRFLAQVAAVRFEFPRVDRVRALIARHYLTSQQLVALLDEFEHARLRLQVIKACASHLVDPESGLERLAAKLAPWTDLQAAAKEALSRQTAAP